MFIGEVRVPGIYYNTQLVHQNDTVNGPVVYLMYDGVNSVRSKSGPMGF